MAPNPASWDEFRPLDGPRRRRVPPATRFRSVTLGFPSGRTAAPKIRIVIIPVICCQITHRKQSGRRYNGGCPVRRGSGCRV